MRRISLVAFPTLLVLGFCVSTASAASPSPLTTDELKAEAAEAAAEAAEDTAAEPQDIIIAQTDPKRKAKIELLKERIERLRTEKRVLYRLPHSTTRYKVHRPKKRERIKADRARIRELRAG
jgi:hypothetical protein